MWGAQKRQYVVGDTSLLYLRQGGSCYPLILLHHMGSQLYLFMKYNHDTHTQKNPPKKPLELTDENRLSTFEILQTDIARRSSITSQAARSKYRIMLQTSLLLASLTSSIITTKSPDLAWFTVLCLWYADSYFVDAGCLCSSTQMLFCNGNLKASLLPGEMSVKWVSIPCCAIVSNTAIVSILLHDVLLEQKMNSCYPVQYHVLHDIYFTRCFFKSLPIHISL